MQEKNIITLPTQERKTSTKPREHQNCWARVEGIDVDPTLTYRLMKSKWPGSDGKHLWAIVGAPRWHELVLQQAKQTLAAFAWYPPAAHCWARDNSEICFVPQTKLTLVPVNDLSVPGFYVYRPRRSADDQFERYDQVTGFVLVDRRNVGLGSVSKGLTTSIGVPKGSGGTNAILIDPLQDRAVFSEPSDVEAALAQELDVGRGCSNPRVLTYPDSRGEFTYRAVISRVAAKRVEHSVI